MLSPKKNKKIVYDFPEWFFKFSLKDMLILSIPYEIKTRQFRNAAIYIFAAVREIGIDPEIIEVIKQSQSGLSYEDQKKFKATIAREYYRLRKRLSPDKWDAIARSSELFSQIGFYPKEDKGKKGSFFREMSEREIHELLKLKALTKLYPALFHEFKNIFASFHATAALLLEEKEKQKIAHIPEHIKVQAQKAQELLEGLWTFFQGISEISGEKPRILCSERDIASKENAEKILGLLGFDARFAVDNAEATRIYTEDKEKGHPYSSVVLDLDLPASRPEALGFEIQKLLISDPNVIILLHTNYPYPGLVSNVKKYKISGIVTKPYKIEEFVRTFHNIITQEKEY